MITYFRHKSGFGDGTAFIRAIKRGECETLHLLPEDGAVPKRLPGMSIDQCREMVARGYWLELTREEARALVPRAITPREDLDEIRELASSLESFFVDGFVCYSLLTKERLFKAGEDMKRIRELLP